MLDIKKDFQIKELTTFRLDSVVSDFVFVSSKEELCEAITYANKNNLEILILGGGSNILFSKKYLNILVIKLNFLNIDKVLEENEDIYIKAGAGVVFDEFIKEMVSNGISGVESLSLIPGVVGSTPIQNVGAYGVEIKDVLKSVYVLDRVTLEFKELSNKDCNFGYRDSIFKQEEGKNYIITEVLFKLKKTDKVTIPQYKDLIQALQNKRNISLSDIRNEVIAIRNKKLPDPRFISSCGSFFKNPIVKKEIANKVLNIYPNAPIYEVDKENSKIGAGFLIDALGFKG
jgi:UDP-N-acetylmuramate dehydrogenase